MPMEAGKKASAKPPVDSKYRDDLQRWAVEQVIKLHEGSNMTTDRVLEEAKVLVNYILEDNDK